MSKTIKCHRIYEFVVSTYRSKSGLNEILKSIFQQHGIKEEDIIESRIDRVLALSSYFRSKARARCFRQRIASYQLKDTFVRLRSLESHEWQKQWKEDFQPFRLSRSIHVAPLSYHRKYPIDGRRVIFLDTVLAFGTGFHETTRFMATLIERCRGRFQNFFDIGTGSGILAILAYVHGAQNVVAVDIDKNCVEIAQKNLSANGCGFATIKTIDVAQFKSRERFDFVAANLISYDLIRLREKLISFVCPGKYLAISGISKQNFPKFKKIFGQLPLRCLKIEKGKHWVAVLYQRIK